MRGRVSDPFQPLRAAHITKAPGFAGGWLPSTFNRTANGMAPWPRGAVAHHAPRGQGTMPLSAG